MEKTHLLVFLSFENVVYFLKNKVNLCKKLSKVLFTNCIHNFQLASYDDKVIHVFTILFLTIL